MGTRDKRVDAYIAKSAEFAKPILTHIRELVHQACPGAKETIKWGFPHFDDNGLLCHMASFKKHCAFGLWKAKLLSKYLKELKPVGQPAMGDLGRITRLEDLPSDTKFRRWIKEAARLNRSKAAPAKPAPAKPRKKLLVPIYFRRELNKNPKAKATFDTLSYSHRKDYVEWVTEAKTETTRSKRIATSLEWLAAGKGRHWKYER
jgi:uncharacterized protein YdeI (YjbR/CyaY-like superfamily)